MRLKKALAVSSLIIIVAVACGGAPAFTWTPELWAGDSRTQSIVRMEGEEVKVMPTSDPQFDDMVCMQADEPRKAVHTCNEIIKKCKAWE